MVGWCSIRIIRTPTPGNPLMVQLEDNIYIYIRQFFRPGWDAVWRVTRMNITRLVAGATEGHFDICWYLMNDRRKFRSQTSDNMDRWKSKRWEESEKRRAEERRSEKRKSEKKEDAGVRKGRNVAKHCVFPMICSSGGSKSRLAKAAGAEPSG